MANIFGRSTGTSTIAGTTIHTVGAGETVTIIGFRVANNSASSTKVTVEINGVIIGKNVPIPVGGGYEFIEAGSKIVALAGDTVVVYSDVDNDCDVYLSYLTQT